MEEYRNQLVEGLKDPDIVPTEVDNAAFEISTVLNTEFNCKTSAEVKNLTIVLTITEGIFIAKDFYEFVEDGYFPKVTLTFSEEQRKITITSYMLH